ncbi:hypothetical protein BJ170DRAFT_684026 [Xylariales sp. AK1849]|nr:hypothetical protein BJ170DRAFT_684026 [Xylariales sp. AK1849]
MRALNLSVYEVVILAADAILLAILLHLPLLADDKNVICVFLPSKIAIGEAYGVSRSAIAASNDNDEASDLITQVRSLKDNIKRPMTYASAARNIVAVAARFWYGRLTVTEAATQSASWC